MFFKTAYLSVENAQMVADSIAHLMKGGGDEYFVLGATTADESTLFELILRPLPAAENPFSENADRSEAVQCVTHKGARVTLLLPHPKDRQHCPAGIIIPEEGLN